MLVCEFCYTYLGSFCPFYYSVYRPKVEKTVKFTPQKKPQYFWRFFAILIPKKGNQSKFSSVGAILRNRDLTLVNTKNNIKNTITKKVR